MKIAIIGSGYVGLVTGACFAQVGHEVICVDNDQRKVKALNNGTIPIYEPGLEQLVLRNVAAGRLQFTGSVERGVDNSEVIFSAVPTPPRADGSVDLTYIEQVAREIAPVLKEYRVIVDKSTVPVAVRDAEALVLATEWPEFGEVDLSEVHQLMRMPVVFDGRNLFNPSTMRDLGFEYFGIGRPLAESGYGNRNSNGARLRADLLASPQL
jgi:UDP-glucose 6-dehydrogenase